MPCNDELDKLSKFKYDHLRINLFDLFEKYGFCGTGWGGRKLMAGMSETDVERIQESAEIMRSFGVPGVETPVADDYLKDNQVIKFGNTEIKVIFTPGHTQGSVCYSIDDKLFSGDTLFKGSVGRCDLPGGDFSQIQTSIKDILFELDDSVTVFPGHGEKTTIGYEKKFNEIL